MTTISKTNNYDLFKFHENNRDIKPPNLKRILESIKSNNLLQFRPILVDKNMNVIDGQHRLEAAKILGLEVYYQVRKDATHEDIVLLNSNQQAWTYEDYFKYYISLGNEDYRKIKEYCEERKIYLTEFVRLLEGGRNKFGNLLKNGSLKFPSREKIKEIDELLGKAQTAVNTMRTFCISNNKFLRFPKFLRALQNFLKNPDVDFGTFIEKVTIKSSALKVCGDIASYYVMLRDIYNWKNHNPID